jgi:large subunit ribosomal protein L10
VDRAEKREMVEDLGQVFAESGSVVVTRYTGLTVAQLTDLRRKMKTAGAQFKVIKNRLAKIALQNSGVSGGGDMFVQPTGIAYAKDPVAAAKVAAEYAKGNEKFVLVGGLLGKVVLDKSAVETLAKMPSLDEMRAKLMGTLQAPATQLVRTLNEPGASLARVLDAKKCKMEEAA